MIKISLTSITSGLSEALKRFPAALSVAVVGTFAAIWLSDMSYDEKSYEIENLFHVSLIGFAYLISVSVFFEARNSSLKTKLFAQFFGILLLGGYYFYLPDGELSLIFIIRSTALFLLFHLLVAAVAFFYKGTQQDFWQYNKKLFINFLTGVLYTGVLFLGLSLAILAVDNLFSLNIDEKIYFKLWIFMVGIFSTFFFLSKFPKEFFEKSEEYPTGLRLFTQYVLLPLVTVYLLILYGYEIKIIAQWSLPVGWVSYLIIGFSVAGIFALLLVFPLKNNDKFIWIKQFTKFFYFALLPVLILLFVAIGKRISDYGITENRYFILILALWLTFITIFMLIKKSDNIKIIPISLIIVILLSIIGPQSSFNVSEYSQMGRLKALLKQEKILINGKISGKKTKINDTVYREINSIVSHFSEMYPYKQVKKQFSDFGIHMPDTVLSSYLISSKIMEQFAVLSDSYPGSDNYFSLYSERNIEEAIGIGGYDFMYEYELYVNAGKDTSQVVRFGEDSVLMKLTFENCRLNLVFSDESELVFDIDSLIKQHLSHENNNYRTLTLKESFIFSKGNKKALLQIRSLSGTLSDYKSQINNINGIVLFQSPHKKQITK